MSRDAPSNSAKFLRTKSEQFLRFLSTPDFAPASRILDMTNSRIVPALLVMLSAFASTAAIPRVPCRSGDKVETGMQGLTTPDEIAAGKAEKGFNCNADIVGQYQGEGASWQLTAWKNCAYFDQMLNSAETHPGTVVVDVTDPKNPKPTTWLNDNAMLDPWESLKVNPARQLLAAGQRPSTGFSIYDISVDCKNPVKLSYIDIPGSFGHTGQWAPDGKTYYITPLRASPSLEAVDTSDPAHPVLMPCDPTDATCVNGFWNATGAPGVPLGTFHDLEFSKDGNTAYVTMFGAAAGANQGKNGLLILDVSDFQGHKPQPRRYRVLGSLTWDDGSVGAQNAMPILIGGKPYILFSDEAGGNATSCSQGKSGAGFPRLIDISDPKSPKTVAKMQLDIHDPANCTTAVTTQVTSPTSNGGFGFSCHYCNVDDVDDAKIAACNCFASGLRIWDISNISAIKEIAYLKPAAQGVAAKPLPGSQLAQRTAAGFTRHFDWATSKPSFPKDRGATSGDLWTTTQDNGFLVVAISPNATASSGGCASADASVLGLIAFGLAEVLRRRRRRMN